MEDHHGEREGYNQQVVFMSYMVRPDSVHAMFDGPSEVDGS